MGRVRSHQEPRVPSDHGQERPASTSVDHDEREQAAAHRLQLSPIGVCLPGVRVQMASDASPSVELREHTSPFGACQSPLTRPAMEASDVALRKAWLAGLHPIEQIGAMTRQSSIFGAGQRNEGIGTAAPVVAAFRAWRAAIRNARKTLAQHGPVHEHATYIDDLPLAHPPQEPSVPVGRIDRVRRVGVSAQPARRDRMQAKMGHSRWHSISGVVAVGRSSHGRVWHRLRRHEQGGCPSVKSNIGQLLTFLSPRPCL